MKTLKMKIISVVMALATILFVIFFLIVPIINKPSIQETVETIQASAPPPGSINRNNKTKEKKAEQIEIKKEKFSFTKRLSKKGPELRFDMYGKFKNEYLKQGHIDVFDTSKSKRIQKIIINNNFEDGHFDWSIDNFAYNGNEVQLVDLNFDGYLDLRLLDNEGATGNNWYASFLYDPGKGKFIYNRHLSSQSSIIADHKNMLVSSYTCCGGCYEFMKYYKYQKGYYILSKIEWTEMDRTKEPGCFKITGVPKVKDIEISLDRICDPDFSDFIRKKVKVVKVDGLSRSLMEGTGRGTFGI